MKQTTKTVGMGWIAVIIIAAILIVDQIIKIEVKTNMSLGEALRITDWFYIEFIENNGMAYGMTFINKLVLSLVRMFAICGIGWYIWRVVKSGLFSKGYIVCLSMVFIRNTRLATYNRQHGKYNDNKRLTDVHPIVCFHLIYFFHAKDILSRSLRKKSNSNTTPTLIHESAKLNTGEKKTKSSPPHTGTQSGHCVCIIGK